MWQLEFNRYAQINLYVAELQFVMGNLLTQNAYQDIKKSFEDVHLYINFYQISTTMQ